MPSNILFSEIEITINGQQLTNNFIEDVLEVTVENSLHLADIATLVLYDHDLTWVDDPRLEPGKTLTVQMVIGQVRGQVFDGEIVELESVFDEGVQRLIIRAFSRMHRLARGLYARSFINVTDTDIMQKIASEVGLSLDMPSTSIVYPYVFQNNETNLAFLQRRAVALGRLLYVQGRTLYCKEARSSGQPLTLQWRTTLTEFRPRLTTIGQLNSMMVRGWDPKEKQAIVGTAQPSEGVGVPAIGQSKNGAQLAATFGVSAQLLVANQPVISQSHATQIAKGEANVQAGSFIEAEGVCVGEPRLVAGDSVTISDVGNRFSGTYFVTNTVHTYGAHRGYSTQFSVSGYQPAVLLSMLMQREEDAHISGLVIGLVTDNNDPQGYGRVKVKYPWLVDQEASDWARVIMPGAGNQRGIEFLPEVNDEVLVGFEHGDFSRPYVLGGLWNGVDAPPEAHLSSAGKIQKRIIRSRTGHIITLDDNESGGGVTIEDKNGNKVMLDSASNKLTITVKGDASVQAQGNLTLEATGQVQLKGNGVTVDGGVSTTEVKGLEVNVQGSAAVNVKGPMVNLN